MSHSWSWEEISRFVFVGPAVVVCLLGVILPWLVGPRNTGRAVLLSLGFALELVVLGFGFVTPWLIQGIQNGGGDSGSIQQTFVVLNFFRSGLLFGSLTLILGGALMPARRFGDGP